MTAFRPRVIKNAIASVMEGVTGVVRRVPPSLFKRGVHEGQPDATRSVRAGDVRYEHRFDVRLEKTAAHNSTPFSARGGYRNALVPVTIEIVTNLASLPQDEERDARLASIQQDAHTAIQALMYPNNLLLDASGTPTGIVSGLLLGANGNVGAADWELVQEDWPNQLIKSRITAAAIVVIDQTVS